MRAHSAVGRHAVSVAVALCLAASAALAQEAPGPAPVPRRRAPRPAGPARRHRLSRPQVMNVIDEARYVLAEHYAASDRVPDAVAALEDTAAATPDAETRSVTRFNLGMIYQEKLGDQVRARAAFSKVTGRMAATARNRIIAPLRREKKWAEAVEFLKECLEHADEPKDRADVVRQLIQVARTCGDEGLMESVLSSVPGMISYEDAQKELSSRRAKLEETRKARMAAARLRGPRIKRETAGKNRPVSREPKSRRKKEWPRRAVEPPPPVGRGGAAGDREKDNREAPPGF